MSPLDRARQAVEDATGAARRGGIAAAWLAMFLALVPVHHVVEWRERRRREWQARGVEAEARRGGSTPAPGGDQ